MSEQEKQSIEEFSKHVMKIGAYLNEQNMHKDAVELLIGTGFLIGLIYRSAPTDKST